MAIKSVATPRDMVTIFKTGLQAAGYYGSEVVGVNPKELQAAQHHYLEVCGSPCSSRSLFLSLCVLGDPTWRQAVGLSLGVPSFGSPSQIPSFGACGLTPGCIRRRRRSSQGCPGTGGR